MYRTGYESKGLFNVEEFLTTQPVFKVESIVYRFIKKSLSDFLNKVQKTIETAP